MFIARIAIIWKIGPVHWSCQLLYNCFTQLEKVVSTLDARRQRKMSQFAPKSAQNRSLIAPALLASSPVDIAEEDEEGDWRRLDV